MIRVWCSSQMSSGHEIQPTNTSSVNCCMNFTTLLRFYFTFIFISIDLNDSIRLFTVLQNFCVYKFYRNVYLYRVGINGSITTTKRHKEMNVSTKWFLSIFWRLLSSHPWVPLFLLSTEKQKRKMSSQERKRKRAAKKRR